MVVQLGGEQFGLVAVALATSFPAIGVVFRYAYDSPYGVGTPNSSYITHISTKRWS